MAKFFLFPFASAGDKTAVPNDTQPSGDVSYEIGFGADYQKDLATDPDAKPMPRAKTNQLFYDITDAIRQYQTLGAPDFITTVMNGGSPFPYGIYARVRFDAGSGVQIFESKVAANTSDPTDLTKWHVISNNEGGVVPGTVIEWAGLAAPEGYLECDGTAYSRTTYATLFSNTTMTQSGTLTNGANTVSGLTSTARMWVGMKIEGTGIASGTTVASIVDGTNITLSINATASGAQTLRFFAWGNGDGSTTFNVPDDRRRTTIGAGGTGTATIGAGIGQNGGEEAHTQTIAEMPSHNHTGSTVSGLDGGGGGANGVLQAGAVGSPISALTIASQGGGTPFNIMQPSNVKMKCIKY